MVMSHSDVRELCNRFFDAYQDRRVDEVADLLSEDCVIWQVPYDLRISRDALLKGMPGSYPRQRRRTYDDRRINTFAGGFVIQYTLSFVLHSGEKCHLWVCIVAQCKDGKITQINEYIDPSKLPFVPAALQKIKDAKQKAAAETT